MRNINKVDDMPLEQLQRYLEYVIQEKGELEERV